MAFYTIDEYYTPEFYNECKESLKNNNIDFKEFISIKPPYKWYFQIDQEPIMINYDKLTKSSERFLVNKIQALRPNEEYLLQRRNNAVGPKAILKYTENEPLKNARKSDFAIFFNATSKDQLLNITKELPGTKIYYFGRYYNNKFRVALCTNPMIKNYLNPDDILLEREKDFTELGRFESELNFKIFRQKDYLQKYTETTYFKDGKYNPVKIKSNRVDSVRMTL